MAESEGEVEVTESRPGTRVSRAQAQAEALLQTTSAAGREVARVGRQTFRYWAERRLALIRSAAAHEGRDEAHPVRTG